MPPTIATALRDHHDRQRAELGAGRNPLNLVFTREDGGPLDGTVVTHQFHKLLAQADLPQRRFHDLRHSCATLLLAQGVSARVVMEILGHSQIALTMNTYAHVIPELRRGAASKMEDLIQERWPGPSFTADAKPGFRHRCYGLSTFREWCIARLDGSRGQ